MSLPKVIIVGKLPPPYFGPAIATKIILGSRLNDWFKLVHFNNALNSDLSTIGKWSLAKLFSNIAHYRSFLGMLRREKAEMILIPISQTTVGFIKDALFIFLASRFSNKVLIQLRGSNFLKWYTSSNPVIRSFVRYIFRSCEGVIVLGHSLKYIFEPFFPDNRIHVVPNGANFSIPEATASVSDKVRVFYLGNFMKSKGITDVIEAARIVEAKQAGSFRLDAMGHWMEEDVKEEVTRKVEENSLPVTFVPSSRSEEKMEYMANADIFLFPPRDPEGHPWVIVESMAAGLPIISTDQGAITESVIDGVNGFIVDPGKPEQIAEHLSQLINNIALRQEMGRKSRERYELAFNEDAMVDNLRKTFEAVLQSPRRGSA